MDILRIKDASALWGISVRRITVLCNQGRITGAKKIAGVWLLPKNAEKPTDARVKTGKYRNWRNKADMKSDDFESNLRNLRGTLAIENMSISEDSMKNLQRIESGEVSYTVMIEELKRKHKNIT